MADILTNQCVLLTSELATAVFITETSFKG